MSWSGDQQRAITAACVDTVSLVQKCQLSRISVSLVNEPTLNDSMSRGQQNMMTLKYKKHTF
jgi:hypothetical protein